MSILKSGDTLRDVLLSKDEIRTKISGVHTLVDDETSKKIHFPYIVYQRSGVNREVTKDDPYRNVLYYTIYVIATDYEQGLDIACDVDDALYATKRAKFTLQGGGETYEGNGVFIQTLDYEMVVEI